MYKFDYRYLQILFLSSFLAYGVQFLEWDISIEKIACVVILSTATQGLLCLAYGIPVNAIKSSMITALGISIIMRSNYVFIYGMAGFFGVASKFVFRSQNKHFFNPANFGVVFMVLFTGVAWISPAQWGNASILLFILGSMGLLILTNIRKMDLAIAWIVFYFGMDFYWNIYYKQWPIDHFIHNISSGSMILFTFFMITDPSSTPNSRMGRVIWVFLVAILAFYLHAFKFIKGAPLYSLFILSFIVPMIDYIFKKEARFSWDSMYRRPLYSN